MDVSFLSLVFNVVKLIGLGLTELPGMAGKK